MMKTPATSLLFALAVCLGICACETSKTHGPPLEKENESSPPKLEPNPGGGRSMFAATSARPGGDAPDSQAGPEKRGKAVIGEPAPDFSLTSLDGKAVRLSDFKGKTVVLEWFSPTCPYSVFAWSEKGPLRELSERLKSDGIVWLTINSEDPAIAGGEIDRTRRFAAENKMNVSLVMDPAGSVGRLYGAKSTPHMYVISARGVLVYRGALDNAPLGTVKDAQAKTNYVEAAINDLKAGHAVTAAETKPYG